MNFTWGKHEANRKAAVQIRAWVRETFGLSEDSTISVLEMRCPDPDCPPHETVIAILDDPGDPRRYRIFKPMQEVVRDDVTALSGNPER
jgi:hypothetical protein